MKISIIIPTFDRCKLLQRTLPTILAQKLKGGEFEILVVSDGCTDGTFSWLKELNEASFLRVFEQPNRGPGAARNYAAHEATGDVLLFLDDDLVCLPNLAQQHLTAHQKFPHSVVSGLVRLADEGTGNVVHWHFEDIHRKYLLRMVGKTTPQWPYDAVFYANSSVPRADFLACGGYDEGFGLALEDVELGVRFWKAGLHFHLLQDAVTEHIHVKSANAIARIDGEAYGRSEYRLVNKHKGLRPLAEITRLSSGPFHVQWVRHTALALLPLSDLCLMFLTAVTEMARARGMAVQMLRYRHALWRLHGAIKAAGNSTTLQQVLGQRLPVLLYHHVGPLLPGAFAALTVTPEDFTEHMEWLHLHGFIPVRPEDWERWVNGEGVLPKNPILITFDDAYSDLAEFVFPILEARKWPATVFVVTDEIGGSNSWDQAKGCARISCLNAAQIQDWAQRGILFGAHSRSHADLVTIGTEQIHHEVKGSKTSLMQTLSMSFSAVANCFAYPYGSWSENVRDVVAKDFKMAFTTKAGVNDCSTPLLELKRAMVIRSHTLWSLRKLLAVGWDAPLITTAARKIWAGMRRLFVDAPL